MKTKTKVLSAIGAVTMTAAAIAPSMTAIAAPANPNDVPYHVLIQDVDEKTKTGTAYQLIKLNVDATYKLAQPQWIWADSVAEYLKSQPELAKYVTGENGVAEEFSNGENGKPSLSDDGSMKDGIVTDNGAYKVYEAITTGIKSGKITGLQTTEIKRNGDSGPFLEFDIKGYGAWLAVPSATSDVIYRPMVAVSSPILENGEIHNQPTNYIDVIAKKSEPGVVKTTPDPRVGVNETVPFTLTADFPVYPKGATEHLYKIGDRLPAGLTYSKQVSIKAVKYDGTKVDLQADDYKFTNTPSADNVSLLEWNLTDYAGKHQGEKIKSIEIVYETTVTDKAKVSDETFENNASIYYNNDPYTNSEHESQPSRVKLYTYGMKATKVDAAHPETHLAGAEFEVRKAGEGEQPALKFVKTADGKYTVTKDDTAGAVTNVAVDDTGNLSLDGFDVGSYTLKEVKAPDGYVAGADIAFEIKDENKDGVEDSSTTNDGYKTQVITNAKGFNLPVTGDAGVIAIAVGAAAMTATGASIFYVSKRKADKASE